MSLQEYHIDDKLVTEWLPWGGLMLPSVCRNKDGSYFSVVQYRAELNEKNIKLPEFRRGWSIWIEKQHKINDKYFIVICWNPFYSSLGKKWIGKMGKIENALSEKQVMRFNELAYFATEVEEIQENIAEALPNAKLLEKIDLLNFLSFTLSFSENTVIEPSLYMYLDVYLSEAIKFTFLPNNVLINDKPVLILSFLSCPEKEIVKRIYDLFHAVPYRYVKRLLCFNKAEAEIELKRYMKSWCNNRKVVKSMLKKDLISNINGYYSENFLILLENKKVYEDVYHNSRTLLDSLEVPYILEKFNLKDIWWGSIPSIFRANITPPITGFNSFKDLLI